MGQKVNPTGIRLGINKTWSSRWFSKSSYAKLLHEDINIRNEAEKELKSTNNILLDTENELYKLLIPKDINDEKNSIIEIRAGTGGDEASLFASDLFEMYQKYSDLQTWKFEVLSITQTGLKGIKDGTIDGVTSDHNPIDIQDIALPRHRVESGEQPPAPGLYHSHQVFQDLVQSRSYA